MPIPVVDPGTALPITDSVNALAEQLLVNFIRLVAHGTTGAAITTPGVTVDDKNGGTTPVVIATKEAQLFIRHQMLALAAVLASGADAEVVGTTSGPTTASGSFVVIPEMTESVTSAGGSLLVQFSGSFGFAAADAFDFSIFVDNSEVANSRRHMESAIILASMVGSTQALVKGLAAGAHIIEVRWRATAGAARAVGTLRSLTIVEV